MISERNRVSGNADPFRILLTGEPSKRSSSRSAFTTGRLQSHWLRRSTALEGCPDVRHRVRALRAKPVLGRVFTQDEDKPGAPRVVVLSNGLWQDRFGGDPAILNQR